MNNNDERDYAEEESNRRHMREEGASELAAERAERDHLVVLSARRTYSVTVRAPEGTIAEELVARGMDLVRENRVNVVWDEEFFGGSVTEWNLREDR